MASAVARNIGLVVSAERPVKGPFGVLNRTPEFTVHSWCMVRAALDNARRDGRVKVRVFFCLFPSCDRWLLGHPWKSRGFGRAA